MSAEIRFSAGDAWVVCARCGTAMNAYDDVLTAEDAAAAHTHSLSLSEPDAADLQTA